MSLGLYLGLLARKKADSSSFFLAGRTLTWRGLWGSLLITLILFSVSAFTKKTDAARLQQTTVNWGAPLEPFQGLSDWRLHMSGVAILTMLAYWWLW